MEQIIKFEEIDDLMPSREIDALIAERYMGWKIFVHSDIKNKNGWYETVKECRLKEIPFDLFQDYGNDFFGYRIPYFTSKIEDAWELDHNDFKWNFLEDLDKLTVTLYIKDLVIDTIIYWNEVADSKEAYALGRSRCVLKFNMQLTK